MSWIENLLILSGLLLDVFAAVECQGSLVSKVDKRHLSLICLLIGAGQLLALYVGYFLASLVGKREAVSGNDALLGNVIAILIFFGLGVRLAVKAVKNEQVHEHLERSLGYRRFVMMALGSGIYTILTGIAFGFLRTGLIMILVMVAAVSVVYIVAGMYTGYHFGYEMKRRAYLIGAVLLWLAGADVIVRCSMDMI